MENGIIVSFNKTNVAVVDKTATRIMALIQKNESNSLEMCHALAELAQDEISLAKAGFDDIIAFGSAIGMGKSTTYQMASIGASFVKKTMNGKKSAYECSLPLGGNSKRAWSTTQLGILCTLLKKYAVEDIIAFINDGKISSSTPTRALKEFCKGMMNPEKTDESGKSGESESGENDENGESVTAIVETITLYDASGKKYTIPLEIVEKYSIAES